MPVSLTDIKQDEYGIPIKGQSNQQSNVDEYGIEKKNQIGNGSSNSTQNSANGVQSTSQLPLQSNSVNSLPNPVEAEKQREKDINSNLEYGTPRKITDLPLLSTLPKVANTPQNPLGIDWNKVQTHTQLHQQLIDQAVTNTAINKLNSIGVDPTDPKNKQKLDFQKEYYKEQVNNGDASLSIGANGNAGLKRKVGIVEALSTSYDKSKTESQDADLFVNNMNTQQKVDYLKQQSQNNPHPEYVGKDESGTGAIIGNLLGGNANFLGKAAAGTATGAALVYATPETLGQSLAGLPTALSFAFTAPDAVNEGAKNEIVRRYTQLKQDNPNMSDTDAMNQAESGKWAGGLAGLTTNALLMGGGEPENLLEKPLTSEGKNVIANTIGEAAKSGTKMGAISGGVTAAKELEGKAEGVNTSLNQIGEDVGKDFLQNASVGAVLHTLTSALMGGIKTATSEPVINALKYAAVTGSSLDAIHSTLSLNEKAGNIPQGTADAITNDLQKYKDATDKIPPDLSADKKADIADLIQKKESIKELQKNHDSNFKDDYDNQLAAIDDQIKKVIQRPEQNISSPINTTSNETEATNASPETEGQKVKKAGDENTPAYLLSRHSDTIKDEQSKVSGTDMNPLSDNGKKDASTLADDVQKHATETGIPVTKIVSSDLERAKETAQTVADKTGATVAHDPDLRTWDIGEFNDTKDDEFKKVQKWFVEHPDETIYKPEVDTKEGEKPEDKDPLYGKKVGETFNDYKDRTIEAHQKYDGEPASTMLIDHSNNMMVMDAFRKNGNTWDEKAAQDYINSEKPEPATLQNKSNEINSETNPENKQNQQPTEETSHPNQTVDEDTQTANGEGKPIGGLSHKSLTAIADKLGLNDPERGTYLPIEEQDERGRKLLAAGADPDRIIQDFKNDGKVSADGNSVIKARVAELEKAADDALDKYGRNSNEFKIAQKELQSFNVDAKKIGTATGEALHSLKDASNVNTTSQTSMEEALKNKTGQQELTSKQIKQVSDLIAKNKELETKNAELEKKLTDAIEKAVNDKKMTDEKTPKKNYYKERKDAFDAARIALKKLRTGESGLGVGVPLIRELAAIAPHITKIVKSLIEEGIDNLKDIVDRIHDEFSGDIKGLRKRDVMDVIAGDYDKKTDNTQNPDEQKLSDIKTQARLTKKLQDLQNDLPEDYDKSKKDQSDEVKNLLEQIKKIKSDIAEYKNNNDLITRFADKKDNEFNPKDVKDIWNYAKKNYLDKGKSYQDMITGTATDLGLKPSQVINAIASPKEARPISDALYVNRSKYSDAQNEAKDYVRNANQKGIWNAIRQTTQFWFNKTIFGHGTVGMQTHAGQSLFIPSTWGSYFKNFIIQFKNSFGGLTDKGLANYEKRMDDLRASPNFILAKRAGLANDPKVSYDEYTGLQKYITSKLGNAFGNVKGMGDRGFNTIKQFRQDFFDHYYNSLSDVEKADPNSAKNIADLANHATGTTGAIFAPGSKTETAANAALFAPKLQGSKFARLIMQPIEATNTLLRWGTASPSEKAAAKIVATRTGQFLATYASALALNQGMLNLAGSKQKINFTDPTKSDFLKFKGAGKTFDASGGMINAIGFMGGLIKASFEPTKYLPKGKSRGEVMEKVLGNFASNTLSPIAGTVKDIATQHDYSGNTLPFSHDKPLYKDAHKLTWTQYLTQTQLPIPVSDAFKTVSENMHQQGMPHSQINNILGGILHAVITGGTGVKIGTDYEKKK